MSSFPGRIVPPLCHFEFNDTNISCVVQGALFDCAVLPFCRHHKKQTFRNIIKGGVSCRLSLFFSIIFSLSKQKHTTHTTLNPNNSLTLSENLTMTITQNIRINTRVVRASYADKNRVTQAQFRVETEEIDLDSVKPGGIILRNLYLSLDPCKYRSQFENFSPQKILRTLSILPQRRH